MASKDVILPGSVLGMLGGGQLGRMSILAGRRMGYRFVVFEPAEGCAAGMVADEEVNADYGDAEALKLFAGKVARSTLEFENIPGAAVQVVEDAGVKVFPGRRALEICQNRRREKEFLRDNGVPCAEFVVVDSPEALRAAVAKLGTPCVLKTADFGYDGKGQVKITGEADWAATWASLKAPLGVVEKWIPFACECSVICARGLDGATAVFPMAENVHRRHILHQTIVPARVPEALQREGEALARRIAEALDLVGLLAVELFVTREGRLLVNELAPRPHNSGHYSFDACLTSQFEQHIRAICGLPLGDPALLRPVVMVNILGDLWKGGREPDWAGLLADPSVKLHLYDKGEPRPGRKMGHFCVLDKDAAAALARAEAHFARLEQG